MTPPEELAGRGSRVARSRAEAWLNSCPEIEVLLQNNLTQLEQLAVQARSGAAVQDRICQLQTDARSMIITAVEKLMLEDAAAAESEFHKLVPRRLLGGGAFGRVLEVRDTLDGLAYAIKCVPLSDCERMRLLREVSILAGLCGKSVVQYYNAWEGELPPDWRVLLLAERPPPPRDAAAGVHSRRPDSPPAAMAKKGGDIGAPGGRYLCIKMELCTLGSLKDWLETHAGDRSAWFEADMTRKRLRIVCQIVCGVDFIHSKNIVHRDLKTANIFVANEYVRDDGSIKIGDFGLATTGPLVHNAQWEMTTGGGQQQTVRAGTPQYMAPEQLAGRPCDRKADIFSLGLVLIQLFVPAATGADRDRLLEQARVLASVLPALSAAEQDTETAAFLRRGGLPEAVCGFPVGVWVRLVLQLMHLEPGERPEAWEFRQPCLNMLLVRPRLIDGFVLINLIN